MELPYVRFWNEMAMNEYDGYVVKEDEQHFHLIYPLTYDWLSHQNRWDLLEQIPSQAFEKSFFLPRVVPRVMGDQSPIHWLLDFPIETFGVERITKVANFFEHFLYYGRTPIVERLEKTIDRTYFLLEKNEMRTVIQFILNHYEQEAKEQRLKIVLSGKIQEFLV